MPNRLPSLNSLSGYAVAVAAVAAATALRVLLDPLLGDLFPFATLFFAVLVVAWQGGFGPAVAATLLGAVFAARFLLPPRDSILVEGTANQSGLALYVAVSFGIALLGGGMSSARRRAEEAAGEAVRQREEARATLASIGDAVIVTDAAGRVTSMNAVAEALTGWPAADAAGRPLEAVFPITHEETGRAVASPVATVLREGSVVEMANHTTLTARDGTRRPIEDSAAPVRDAAGRLLGVVLVFRDVAARRAAEQALREANRRKDEFLAMLGHELRNPLAPVRSGLALLRGGAEGPEREEVVAVMERQTEHLVRLVDDLLDVSRVTQGRVALRKEPVQVATVLNRSIEMARSELDAAGHRPVVTPAEPLWVEGDPVRLVQVVTNLLTNAAKYTPAGGTIRLNAERVGDRVQIRVRDTGAGIDPARLPHIFGLFVQGDRTLDRAGGGLGIGLTVVKTLVELHGGSVTAHSEGSGKGSEFTVSLPLHAEPPGPAAGEPDGGVEARALRVLVVEDNTAAAKMLEKLLVRFWGHEVRLTYDGPSALEAAAAFRPELVICDIGLPGIDGYEVCRLLRERPEGRVALIVALTGYGQEEDRKRALAAGFDEHLVKPPSVEMLRRLSLHPSLARAD